jgi:sulfoxide reductase catalytic subunit YedY
MLIKRIDKSAAKEADITPQSVWRDRRRFLGSGAALALGPFCTSLGVSAARDATADALPAFTKSDVYQVEDDVTNVDDVTSYNNFYEFGLDKASPAKLAHTLKTRPWTLAVEGECENPKQWDIEELIKAFPLEERTYRFRCVETWSMVVPWIGFPMDALIKASKPTSKAKYVMMETLVDEQQMPEQQRGILGSVLDWPYTEGLRIDEAAHPLTLLTVGLYGEVLANQNGAPLRLMVPWKYGFKSIKSIVTLKFVEEQPLNTWQQQAAREYGFYANVNPEVDHPRWSQAKERRLGEWLKRDTLPFNGYADDVASLYAGMDLSENF